MENDPPGYLQVSFPSLFKSISKEEIGGQRAKHLNFFDVHFKLDEVYLSY